MSKKKSNDLVSNRKALFNYEVLETLEAGIALKGTEIKSLRDNGGSLQDAYIIVSNGEAILKNCNIAPYRFGNVHNHPERRDRVLLLHKREIERLKKETDIKGNSLIPLALYLKKGYVKVKVALAKGKKSFDKRHSIKEREQKRDMDRALKA